MPRRGDRLGNFHFFTWTSFQTCSNRELTQGVARLSALGIDRIDLDRQMKSICHSHVSTQIPLPMKCWDMRKIPNRCQWMLLISCTMKANVSISSSLKCDRQRAEIREISLGLVRGDRDLEWKTSVFSVQELPSSFSIMKYRNTIISSIMSTVWRTRKNKEQVRERERENWYRTTTRRRRKRSETDECKRRREEQEE